MTAFLLAMPDFSSPEVWLSLLTLTFLEVVLGIDNIVFISILANKLPEKQQPRARFIGLSLALIFRVLMLFGITWLIRMQEPIFSLSASLFAGNFSGQSLILIAGGLFLLYKSTSEIHHKLEGHQAENKNKSAVHSSLAGVIIQIGLIDIVFSFDSILTAVGLTDHLAIMIIAVVIAIIIMMVFVTPVGNFVNKHPSIQMLGLSFLILIGFMLVAEGAHLANVTVASAEIGSVPKGYLYFAIIFSLGVEFLNMRLRKKRRPVQLHGISEEAVREGILDQYTKEK